VEPEPDEASEEELRRELASGAGEQTEQGQVKRTP
jgi:hypothetical protein